MPLGPPPASGYRCCCRGSRHLRDTWPAPTDLDCGLALEARRHLAGASIDSSWRRYRAGPTASITRVPRYRQSLWASLRSTWATRPYTSQRPGALRRSGHRHPARGLLSSSPPCTVSLPAWRNRPTTRTTHPVSYQTSRNAASTSPAADHGGSAASFAPWRDSFPGTSRRVPTSRPGSSHGAAARPCLSCATAPGGDYFVQACPRVWNPGGAARIRSEWDGPVWQRDARSSGRRGPWPAVHHASGRSERGECTLHRTYLGGCSGHRSIETGPCCDACSRGLDQRRSCGLLKAQNRRRPSL